MTPDEMFLGSGSPSSKIWTQAEAEGMIKLARKEAAEATLAGVQKDLDAAWNERDEARALLAQAQIDRAEAKAALATARAVAFEEAAWLVDVRHPRWANPPPGSLMDAIRALAPLPPGLVVLTVEDRDAVVAELKTSEAVASNLARMLHKHGEAVAELDSLKAAKRIRDLLAALDRSTR